MFQRCVGGHVRLAAKPLHCTSQGKAILSALDDATRDALLQGIILKALTPRTITDRRRLQAELKITAARGWSIDDEEIVPGVRCVGAPVVDAAGKVRGAISVAGPAYRMTMERVQ
ncbi:MAG: IclR family transcriptional regulator C-terminal domain-containing protein [Polaromonas sp.]